VSKGLLNQKAANAEEKSLLPLTKMQIALMEVLREPKNASHDVDELCKLAGISRATYYNAFKDDNFVRALEIEMTEYRNRADFAVMHNLVEQAKTTKNHHMIMMFEKLQGRLKEGGDKPAQIILVFGNGEIKRPSFVEGKVIEGEAVKGADKD